MKGRLIIVEGSDCSGKETQSNLLLARLNQNGYTTVKMQCPFYDSPTGQVIGGPYLGKEKYCNSYFLEGADKVNSKVASLYYAADRLYNLPKITLALENSNLIMDRYVDSNKIHQCSKIRDAKQREEQYKFIDSLEYDLLELPRPDIKLMLYMPIEYRAQLLKNRDEKPDDLEKSGEEYQKGCLESCVEVANRDGYKFINCVKDGKIRSIEDIHEDVYAYVLEQMK